MNIAGFIIANHAGVYRKRRKASTPHAPTAHPRLGPPVTLSSKAIAHVAESRKCDAQSDGAAQHATPQTKLIQRQRLGLADMALWLPRAMLRLCGADHAAQRPRFDARARLKAFEQEDALRRHTRVSSQKTQASDKQGSGAITHSMSAGVADDVWDAATGRSKTWRDDACGNLPVQPMAPAPTQTRWLLALWRTSQ